MHRPREFAEPLEAGRRRERRIRLVVRAQDAEHRAQVVESVLARAPNRLERTTRLGGVGVDDVRGGAGLHGDDRQRVGGDVVKLAGDVEPLLVDAAAGLVFAGALRVDGSLLDFGDVGATVARRIAERCRDRDHGDDPDGIGPERDGHVAGYRHRELKRGGEPRCDDERTAAAQGADRVERDERREEDERRRSGNEVVGRCGDCGDDEYRHGIAAPKRERQERGGDEDVAEGGGTGLVQDSGRPHRPIRRSGRQVSALRRSHPSG